MYIRAFWDWTVWIHIFIYLFLSTESKAAVKEAEPVTNVMKNPSKVIVLRVSTALISYFLMNMRVSFSVWSKT